MLNPFYWLEIRIRSREKRLWIVALFFLLSVLLMGGGILAVAVVEKFSEVVPGKLGMSITYVLLFWHGAILIVLAPLASAGRLAQEREQRTLPALINTTVHPDRIVYGKLLGAWTFILWMSALILPFVSIGIVWGGLAWWKAPSMLLMNILVSMVISAIALGFSGVFGRSLTAYLVAGSFMLAWMVVLPILGSIGYALISAAEAKAAESIIGYVFLYHHPFFPAILISTDAWDIETGKALVWLLYCMAVWLLLALGGITLARRGLKREIY